jgi:hypothetical protein
MDAATRESLLERGMTLLKARPGQGICINCLAEALSRTPKDVRGAVLRLEENGDFRRGFATCVICLKDRFLLRAGADSA